MPAFRAAYLAHVPDGFLLTGSAHQHLPEEDLMQEALRVLEEFNHACRCIGEPEADISDIVIGEWTPCESGWGANV